MKKKEKEKKACLLSWMSKILEIQRLCKAVKLYERMWLWQSDGYWPMFGICLKIGICQMSKTRHNWTANVCVIDTVFAFGHVHCVWTRDGGAAKTSILYWVMSIYSTDVCKINLGYLLWGSTSLKLLSISFEQNLIIMKSCFHKAFLILLHWYS